MHQAALLDPNAAASLDLDTIRTVCDELLAAHGDALRAGPAHLMDLLVVGDVNADLVLRGGEVDPTFGQREQFVDHAELVLGGSGGIMAAGAAKLGLDVAIVACVGDDPLGTVMIEALEPRAWTRPP